MNSTQVEQQIIRRFSLPIIYYGITMLLLVFASLFATFFRPIHNLSETANPMKHIFP